MIKIIFPSGESYLSELKEDDNYEINGKPLSPDIKNLGKGVIHLILNNKSYTAQVLSFDKATKTLSLTINQKVVHIKVQDKFDDLLHELGMDEAMSQKAADLKAPMPGLVVEVSVEAGDVVKKGDKLLVLEAMKMENILKAAADGMVKKVNVNKSNAVEKNQVLVEFQ